MTYQEILDYIAGHRQEYEACVEDKMISCKMYEIAIGEKRA